jgi:hypothetical protein
MNLLEQVTQPMDQSYRTEKDWCIYVLKHPITDEVRYVGFTSRSPEKRLKQHLIESRSSRFSYLYRCRWVSSIVTQGLLPKLEVIETGKGDGWPEAERRWISKLQSQGVRLTNATVGGDGSFGWGTPKQRSDAIRNNWEKCTPEQRAVRIARAAASFTPEMRREAGLKSMAKITPEQRSQRMLKVHANRMPEERKAIAQKSASRLTREQKSEVLKKRWASISIERRAEIGEKHRLSESREKRSEVALKLWASRTTEQKKQICSNGHTPEARAKRSESLRRMHAAKTPEDRAEVMRKAWVTRRARQLNTVNALSAQGLLTIS